MIKSLEKILSKIPAISPKTPQNRDIVIYDDCPDEIFDKDEHALGQAFFITYTNARGENSSRTISVKNAKKNKQNNWILSGYCHTRKMPRNFRTDRMTEVINTATGMIYDTQHSITKLAIKINAFQENESKDTTIDIIHSMKNEIIVLTFLSRCDGEMHPLEIEEIKNHIKEANHTNINDKILTQTLMGLYPSHKDFKIGLNTLKENNKLDNILICAGNMIYADKILHKKEKKYFNDLLTNLDMMKYKNNDND